MSELALAYSARAQGKTPTWAAPARTFHEFAQLQQAQGVNAQHLAYWTDMLRNATPGLHLPDTTHTSQASLKAQWCELTPEAGVLDSLYAAARRHDSSLFSVVYSAIALSLHKLGNLSDLVIGTSASGRTDPAFYDTIGYFTTMVAHRVQFATQQSLASLLKQVTHTVNDSMPYADVPLAHIQHALGMTPADGLLFDVYIQIHANNALNGALSNAESNAIRYRQIDPDKTSSMFGLQFEIMEDILDQQRVLRLVVTYRTDRYSPALVEKICAGISQAFALFANEEAVQSSLAELMME